MYCKACLLPRDNKASSIAPTRDLCTDCYRRLTSGTEPYGSPLCRRMWSAGVPLLLLPGNRVRLALASFSASDWRQNSSRAVCRPRWLSYW